MKRFPIQNGPSVPWHTMEPHEAQSQCNHDQSLERIAQRGGFGAAEAWCIVNGLTWREADKKWTNEEMRKHWLGYAQAINDRESERVKRIAKLEDSLEQILRESDIVRVYEAAHEALDHGPQVTQAKGVQ